MVTVLHLLGQRMERATILAFKRAGIRSECKFFLSVVGEMFEPNLMDNNRI